MRDCPKVVPARLLAYSAISIDEFYHFVCYHIFGYREVLSVIGVAPIFKLIELIEIRPNKTLVYDFLHIAKDYLLLPVIPILNNIAFKPIGILPPKPIGFSHHVFVPIIAVVLSFTNTDVK